MLTIEHIEFETLHALMVGTHAMGWMRVAAAARRRKILLL